jgi:hypothetical protein
VPRRTHRASLDALPLPSLGNGARGTGSMRVGVLALDFHLPGCASLKEKRRRLARLRDKFGRIANLAVCESGFQDSHQRARWSVVAVASDAVVVERSLADVEQWAAMSVDANIVGVDRNSLA